ncbi:hypothetical protein ACFYO7_09110 [Nocardia salmonicida]|uniref:hypothetical protein n=1 Tax=Nocardia salmonicida TaxID=53431 RepID=UPI003681F40E
MTERSSLIRLWLGRGVLAIGWASAFAIVGDTLGAVAVALLVAYPLLDAGSSLHVLSVYATGGGVFFLARAALLAWKSRQSAGTH